MDFRTWEREKLAVFGHGQFDVFEGFEFSDQHKSPANAEAQVEGRALLSVLIRTFCTLAPAQHTSHPGAARDQFDRQFMRTVALAFLVSFEPDIVSVQLDGTQLRLEPGQTVIPHGPDRNIMVGEVLSERKRL